MPPRRTGADVAVDAQLDDRHVRAGRDRRLLVVGDLPIGLRQDLLERRAQLTDAPTIHDAIVLLAGQDFHVVVVDRLVGGRGLDFVNAIKEGPAEHLHTVATLYGARGDAPFLRGVKPPSEEIFDAARARHRLTPFVLLPADAEKRFYSVVVVVPSVAVTLDNTETPLLSTLLTVDPSKLLSKIDALA